MALTYASGDLGPYILRAGLASIRRSPALRTAGGNSDSPGLQRCTASMYLRTISWNRMPHLPQMAPWSFRSCDTFAHSVSGNQAGVGKLSQCADHGLPRRSFLLLCRWTNQDGTSCSRLRHRHHRKLSVARLLDSVDCILLRALVHAGRGPCN
jgi:hypothetical protein